MELSPTCYPFDGHCRCSRDANLSLTFDHDAMPLRVHSYLLIMTSSVLKKAIEECSVGDGTIHLGKDDRNGWLLLLNMVHPISSQTLDRTQILSSMETRVKLGTLAKKYDAEFILSQLDEALYQQLYRRAFRHPSLPNPTQSRVQCPGQAAQSYHPVYQTTVFPLPPPPSFGTMSIPGANAYYFYPRMTEFNMSPPYCPYYGPNSPPNLGAFPSASSSDTLQRPTSSVCSHLLPLIEHAAHFNLVKSWNFSLAQLVPVLRMECLRQSNSPLGGTRLLSSGQNVKGMLQRLRDDGYDQEALNLAIEIFDKL